MPNKIIVEIEALDYEITVRDVAIALKETYPNMPTVVKIASQQSFAPDAAYCHCDPSTCGTIPGSYPARCFACNLPRR